MNVKIQLYEDQPIRTAWVEDEEGSQLVTNCHQLKTGTMSIWSESR